ncbi:MAG: hypothetical protein HY924_09465 [Elusimicrobia bacterium]|nr:hypothetical protein [Elusimicrobiota bacterium]
MAEQQGLSWQRTAAAAAAISVAATFLVGSYEFVRSVSTSLFISAYGSSKLPYAMTAVPFAMALLVYGYGWLLSRVGAMRALVVSSLSSGVVFLFCYAALKQEGHWAAAFLYVFRQVYIVLIVEQYWSLINSFLKPEQARLYNGPIIGGASIGPVLAGWLIHRKAVALGSEQIILLAVLALLPATLLAYLAYRIAGEPKPSTEEAGGKQGHLHLSLLGQNRGLALLAGVVCLAQVVSTAADLRFSQLLEATIPLKDERTAFLGGFWSTTNLASSCLQFLVTPLLLSILPARWIFLGIPAIHIGSAVLLLARPSLQSAALSLLLFKSVDYSLFRATKELIYIPLSFDARYRAKQVIDTFTYRASMGLTSAALSVATLVAGAIPGSLYPMAAMAAAAAWAGLTLPLTAPKEPRDGV